MSRNCYLTLQLCILQQSSNLNIPAPIFWVKKEVKSLDSDRFLLIRPHHTTDSHHLSNDLETGVSGTINKLADVLHKVSMWISSPPGYTAGHEV